MLGILSEFILYNYDNDRGEIFMVGRFIKNMIKVNIEIPYEGNLIYPTNSITKKAIAEYCDKEKLKYKFMEDNEDGNMTVRFEDKDYEVIRKFTGRGGYAIICRPI